MYSEIFIVVKFRPPYITHGIICESMKILFLQCSTLKILPLKNILAIQYTHAVYTIPTE